MGGAGERADWPPIFEHRCHHRQIMQMAARQPRIVGDIGIALMHFSHWIFVEEMFDRDSHGIDMARRTCDGLGKHPPLDIKNAGRKITCLAHRGAERGAQQRLSLLLDDRNQSVPHNLALDALERAGFPAHDDSSPLFRSSTIYPCAFIVASNVGLTTVEVSSSTIMAGPFTRLPGFRLQRR